MIGLDPPKWFLIMQWPIVIVDLLIIISYMNVMGFLCIKDYYLHACFMSLYSLLVTKVAKLE